MSYNPREDKKNVAPCHYKTVATSNLYFAGPACLQATFERSEYDKNLYNISSTSSTAPTPTPTPPASSSFPNMSTSSKETFNQRKCKCGQK